jgi:Flp pilus assembly pilin Flp
VTRGPAPARRGHGWLAAAGRVLADDSGQGLGEYGLILGLIAAVCVAAIVLVSADIQRTLARVSASL